jgi:hypothetical protein
MIISVEQAKALIDLADWKDEKIEMKLKAVEQTIRAYTNNNFQVRGYRVQASITKGALVSESPIPFAIDDTVQISESLYNSGIFTISDIYGTTFTVSEDIKDEGAVLVTKVEYPADVIDCCVNLLEWSKNYGGKVGIKSETLSRHSVTYEDSATLFMGFPIGILNGLKLYKKVRF